MQTKFKLLGTTALAAAALVMAPTMASADQALEKRIKALEKAGGMSVTRTKKTMKLVVSGHVNRAVVLADNGTTSGFHHVTTSFSQTRVRWIGTGKINDDVSVMTYIEMGNNNSNSNNQDLGDNGDQDGNALSDRFAEIRLTSKTMGKLYMGQGSTGTDAVSESDLSGTGIISLNGFGNLISGSEVFQSNGAAATGNAAGNVSSHFSNFDGNSRQDRIRYDTPKFGGMQVTTSHSNNDEWGIALRYGASIGGMKIKAAIGHSDRTHTTTDGLTFNHGAVSVLFPQGISLTVGAADQDNEAGGINDTEEWRYAKIGYKFKGSNVGQTRLFADYSNNENRTAAGNDAEYYSFGIVQIVEPLGAELYGVYRQFSLDTTDGTSPDDVTSIAAGMRFKF